MLRSDRGNAVLAGVVLLGAVVVLAGLVGVAALNGDGGTASGAEATTTTQTTTPEPEPRDVEMGYERANESLFVVAHGGSDLGTVTRFSVDGATVEEGFDLDDDRPRAKMTIAPPTTVTITATFEDGTSRVVAEWTFE